MIVGEKLHCTLVHLKIVFSSNFEAQNVHSDFEWRNFGRSGCMALRQHLICRIDTLWHPNLLEADTYNRWVITHLH